MYFFLDVDGCMYSPFIDPSKGDVVENFSKTRYQFRTADVRWGALVTGRPAEELNEFRRLHAPTRGMDQALLDFISLHTGRPYGIKELAEHRCGPDGYQPEQVLEPNNALVGCLRRAKELDHVLVVVTDNPVTLRTIRQLGISADLIPDNMVFGPERMGSFKNKDVLVRILKELGARPEETVMFGDSQRSDIAPAEEAGITRTFLAKGPEELIRAIENIIGPAERDNELRHNH